MSRDLRYASAVTVCQLKNARQEFLPGQRRRTWRSRHASAGRIKENWHHRRRRTSSAKDTPILETDQNGNITRSPVYLAYGFTTQDGSYKGLDRAPGYAGSYPEIETGLNYMGARYYFGVTGRFLAPDPEGLNPLSPVGLNRYVYANANPTRYTDPTGRAACDWCQGLMNKLFPKGDLFRVTGEALAADTAYVVGVVTNDKSLQAAALDGMRQNVSTGDAIGAATMLVGGRSGRTSTTYIRPNGSKVYAGRTSGTGTPEQQVAARMNSADHKARTAEGYGPAVVDRNSSNPAAIRGREQQLIEQHGGAQSQGGTSGNRINGVSPTNPRGEAYRQACTNEFGC